MAEQDYWTLDQWETWFLKLVAGKAPTPDQLVAMEADLKAMGIEVLRNHAGIAGKIRLPDGTIVDVIAGASIGGKHWQWLLGKRIFAPEVYSPGPPKTETQRRVEETFLKQMPATAKDGLAQVGLLRYLARAVSSTVLLAEYLGKTISAKKGEKVEVKDKKIKWRI